MERKNKEFDETIAEQNKESLAVMREEMTIRREELLLKRKTAKLDQLRQLVMNYHSLGMTEEAKSVSLKYDRLLILRKSASCKSFTTQM